MRPRRRCSPVVNRPGNFRRGYPRLVDGWRRGRAATQREEAGGELRNGAGSDTSGAKRGERAKVRSYVRSSEQKPTGGGQREWAVGMGASLRPARKEKERPRAIPWPFLRRAVPGAGSPEPVIVRRGFRRATGMPGCAARPPGWGAWCSAVFAAAAERTEWPLRATGGRRMTCVSRLCATAHGDRRPGVAGPRCRKGTGSGRVARMVRRDDSQPAEGRPTEGGGSRFASPTGASPVRVIAGEPGTTVRGFDFLGCHLHKRLSGRYLRTGNAALQFNAIDRYAHQRLKRWMCCRRGRNLHAGHVATWTTDWFWNHGLHRMLGTIRYPTPCKLPVKTPVGPYAGNPHVRFERRRAETGRQ